MKRLLSLLLLLGCAADGTQPSPVADLIGIWTLDSLTSYRKADGMLFQFAVTDLWRIQFGTPNGDPTQGPVVGAFVYTDDQGPQQTIYSRSHDTLSIPRYQDPSVGDYVITELTAHRLALTDSTFPLASQPTNVYTEIYHR